jgi:hypothetical protein
LDAVRDCVGYLDWNEGGQMINEFPWIKKSWDWCRTKWRTSFGAILLVVLAFFFGMTYQMKVTTDDCKFSGVFRDGYQTYNCSARVR